MSDSAGYTQVRNRDAIGNVEIEFELRGAENRVTELYNLIQDALQAFERQAKRAAKNERKRQRRAEAKKITVTP
jgi:hypothetical protein